MRENGRRDWQSFQPSPRLIEPIVTFFEGPMWPFVATVEQLMRTGA
jgi:hypothetical protein